MKRWSVIIELPAQEDIAEAHRWLAEHDPEAADRWFNSLYDNISRAVSAGTGEPVFQCRYP